MGRTQRFGPLLQLIILLLALAGNACSAATFTLINKCTYTVWPGLLSGAGIPQPSTTGFSLQLSSATSLSLPSSWSGRIWARTFCSTNTTTGKFSCLTGDCGSGTVQCSGSSAVPPATLAEFTLNGSNGLDFYDVSLVDGYNLPLMVVPQGAGTGNCSATGCNVELNGSCPTQLRMTGNGTQNVGCRSACEAFGKPQYCCSGAYATPSTCKPSAYSKFFKAACPTAYSYAYDDATSTFTCAGADYVITFCPTPAATKKSSGQSPETSSMPPATATATSTSTSTSTPFYFVGAANAPSYALLPIHLTLLSLFTASAFL